MRTPLPRYTIAGALLILVIFIHLQYRPFTLSPSPSALPGVSSDHESLSYLPELLKKHKIGPNITFASRALRPRPHAPSRLPVTEVDQQQLIPGFRKLDLEHDAAELVAASAPIDVPVTNSPRPPQVDASALLFGVSTVFKRFNDSQSGPLKEWKRWLTDGNGRSNGAGLVLCLYKATAEQLQYAADTLQQAGIDATVQASDENLDMPGRYVDLVEILYTHPSRKSRKYLALVDDDTFFPSISSLLSTLSLYNPEKSYYIGSMTERADWMMEHKAPMAYGGAGIFLTNPAAKEIMLADCLDADEDGNYFLPGDQGDLLLYNCIHNRTELALTHVPQLHQLDQWGDPSGFYESGQLPLSLHHFKSWHHVAPDKMHLATDVCGEDCFMQRFKFQDNWVLSNGYSIAHYPRGIDFDLLQMEGTFSNSNDHKKDSVEDMSVSYSFGPLRKKLSQTGRKLSWELLDARSAGHGAVYQTYVKRKDDKRWIATGGAKPDRDSVIVLAWVP